MGKISLSWALFYQTGIKHEDFTPEYLDMEHPSFTQLVPSWFNLGSEHTLEYPEFKGANR